MKTYKLKNMIVISIVGFGLGTLASFLGIGGGPLNMAILVFAFSMSTKEAAINSVFIIFFSQLASLSITGFTTGFSSIDLPILLFMVVGGVSGGFIGTTLSQKISNRQVEKLFSYALMGIFLLNVYNLIHYLV